MSTPTELSVLLRLYTNKQNSPTFILSDFCEYLQKYARHYLQEAPELVMYLENTQHTVSEELEKLAIDSRVVISSDTKNRQLVFVPFFYIDRTIARFRELDEHPEVPFPLASDLPQAFPRELLKPIYITTDFAPLLENRERTNAWLYQLIFPDETPPLIFPASLSPEKLLDMSLTKIRFFLRKDESRDFIQKRMMIASPGKELIIKNYLNQFQSKPTESLRSLKHSGEAFLFWSYLCSFIRQDVEKKAEKTPDEIALLQAVFVTEYLNNFYKTKAQQNLQRETALKNLELAFQKPPYYFDMNTILKFADSRGVPLLGQYQKSDLETFIKENSGDPNLNSLPRLLVFKTDSNRYFVFKEKVIPLAVKLCNDSRTSIKEILTREWYQLLSSYRQDPAMKNRAEFEKKIESLCKTSTPIVYALLTASFIPLFSLENEYGQNNEPNGFRMFDHGRLLPWSELLMLDQQEILTDTRIMLPFWYTLPIISAILAFFHRPHKVMKTTRKRQNNKAVTETTVMEGPTIQDRERHDKKQELKSAAARIEKELVQNGNTLEQELSIQEDIWNRTLNPTMKKNLTEDVNSLIRDYIRQTLRTLRASSFDIERIKNLAEELAATPNLMKIKNADALRVYIQLYILRLIKNLK